MVGVLFSSELAFLPCLPTMAVDGILQYSIPDEKEDYMAPRTAAAPPADIDPQLLMQPQPHETTDNMKSNLRLPPPPLFSRQSVPQNYKCVCNIRLIGSILIIVSSFKANTASIVSTTVDEITGEEKKRLINRMRWRGLGPVSLYYADAQVYAPNMVIHDDAFSLDLIDRCLQSQQRP